MAVLLKPKNYMFICGGKVNLFYPKTYQSGFILVMVIFFLFILSLLALSALNLVVFETKINGLYQNKIKSFYHAEDKLLKMEHKLLYGEKIDNPNIISFLYYDDVNKVTFYRLNMHDGASNIQSVVAVPDNANESGVKTGALYGRQSFVVETE